MDQFPLVPPHANPAKRSVPTTMPSAARFSCLQSPELVDIITSFLNLSSTASFKTCNRSLCVKVQQHPSSLSHFCEQMNSYIKTCITEEDFTAEEKRLEEIFVQPDRILKEIIISWCALRHFRPNSFGKNKEIVEKEAKIDVLRKTLLYLTPFKNFESRAIANQKTEGEHNVAMSKLTISPYIAHLNYIRKATASLWQTNTRAHAAHRGSNVKLTCLAHMHTLAFLEQDMFDLINANISGGVNKLKDLSIVETDCPFLFSQNMLPKWITHLTLSSVAETTSVTTKSLKKLWIKNFGAIKNWTIENPMMTVQITSKRAESTLSNLSFKTKESGLKHLQIDGLVESPIKWSDTVSADTTFKKTASLVLQNVTIEKEEQGFINQFASAQSKTVNLGFHLFCDNVSGLKTLVIASQKGTSLKGTFLLRNMRDLTSIVIDIKYKDLTVKVENCPTLETITIASAAKLKGFVATRLTLNNCPKLQTSKIGPISSISADTISYRDIVAAKAKFNPG